MTKRKSPSEKNDRNSALHQPHDKYVRGVLQYREMAIALITQFASKEVVQDIDLESLNLSDDTFVDEHLKIHFSDICYTGLTLQNEPIRVTIIFEHKSRKPSGSILEQLNRYITNMWSSDLRQGRPLSVPLPILIYHGKPALKKETPETLFPGVPLSLLPFIPRFDYILIDIRHLSDNALNSIGFLLLQKFLLVLKHGLDTAYIEQNWKNFVIFAPDFPDEILASGVFRMTMVYLGSIESPMNKKIENMDNLLTNEEKAKAKPYILQILDNAEEKGIKKGIEKGMEMAVLKFLKKNPAMPDVQVADIFEVPVELVQKIRQQLSTAAS